jgi:Replication-relaxation
MNASPSGVVPTTGLPAADTSTPQGVAAGAPAYRARLRTDPARGARPRSGGGGFAGPAATAARLTARDRWILAMLAEHRVLTTPQLTRLAFGTRRVASLRLSVLHSLGVVHRFRPFTVAGSAPWHWLLAPPGAQVVADDHHTTVDVLGYQPERLARLAVSLHLAHTVGVNDLHTTLAAHGRQPGAGGRLAVWWSERRCEQAWGGRIRPDAYARWHTHPTQLQQGAGVGEMDWFCEYDTGTENLDRVVGKLAGYAGLAADTCLATPVLFWLPGPARETHLRDLIRDWQQTHPGHAALPVATGHAEEPGGPAGRVWAPVTPGGGQSRLTLTGLAVAFPVLAHRIGAPPGGRPEPGPDTDAHAGPGWPAPAPTLPPPRHSGRELPPW